jgi:hypothetical protein
MQAVNFVLSLAIVESSNIGRTVGTITGFTWRVSGASDDTMLFVHTVWVLDNTTTFQWC